MNIQPGWVLYVADFSIQATRKASAPGSITLTRNQTDRQKWLELPDKEADTIPLYVNGHGQTIEEALVNANLAAAHAPAIPDTK
jgi:hypothetical protein